MECGLIGKVLVHSYSQIIHDSLGLYKYQLCELQPEEIPAFFEKKDFMGINVTIPYKQTVIPYLDEISEEAKEIGAVNTIVNRNGKLYGYNTDCSGLTALINKAGITVAGKKVLILGTGGTSKTATYVAKKLGAKEILHVSRKASEDTITYEDAVTNHKDAQIIINTTPCGMYPETDNKPIDISCFNNLSGIVDAIYNPLKSQLVVDGLNANIPSTGGLYMLVAQAIYASGHFCSKDPDLTVLDSIFDSLIEEKRNLVLTGMPSCGKTTIGKMLSKLTGKELIDVDKEIVDKIKMPIADFFAANGEAAFRKIEAETIKELSLLTGKIISTGGGAVLNPKNIINLKLNGEIIFINRPLEDLMPTSDRPLSSSKEHLTKLYNERFEIYKSTCNYEILNDTTAEAAVEKIMKITGGQKNEC